MIAPTGPSGSGLAGRRPDEGRVRQPPVLGPARRRTLLALPAARAARHRRDPRRDRRDAPPRARARAADVFHSPWMDGAMLHSPCPMVVTIHDLARAQAPQRAPARAACACACATSRSSARRVIVPTRRWPTRSPTWARRERIVVIPRRPTRRCTRARRGVAASRALACPSATCCGSAACCTPTRQHIAELAAAPRELPLVLVGSTRPWAHELPT